METRELFWGLQSAGTVAFYLIGISAIGLFFGGIFHAVRKYRRGRPSPVAIHWMTGIKRMIADMLTHRTVRRRDAYAGAAHTAIFFGFGLLFIGTSTITLEYDFLEPLFGITFWKGTFFLGFSLVLDLAGLAVAIGVIMMMVRRATFGLSKLSYLRDYAGEHRLRASARRWQVEDWLFLTGLLLIVLTGFFQEGLRHAMERPSWGAWEPVGYLLGAALSALGVGEGNISVLRAVNWWLHGIGALAFIVALPWYKAKHIIAAMGSLASRDPMALRRLPKLAPEPAAVGIGEIAEFSWKDMLDFDACTKCGRCHDVCPARTAGYPLSPRDFILDLRLHNNKAQGCKVESQMLIGGVIAPETLWACRTCGACLEICPVGIEHPVKIVQMRRHLVENDQLDPLLRTTLNTISTCGNSFGEPARKRAAWTSDLEFKVKDVRLQPADLLWFVGDQASFDPRNQRVSRCVARLFKAAKVDFGLLYEGERTAGNDVRRAGEEGLFESLVEHNLDQMAKAMTFQRIVTTDPHSYNTLRNEYPDFGQIAPVIHYTELLIDLFDSGALQVVKPLGLKVTYHDPCHLGRLNKRYDAPRKVLERIGCELVEMPRNRDNSFCCGAGGGRMWIPDTPGTSKPSEIRLREAAELGCIDVFVTCCPKDLTMFEDARKTAGLEKDFVVEDIAELVARAIDLGAVDLRDLPHLTEQIAAAVADRVALSVGQRLDMWLADHGKSLMTAAPMAVEAPAVGAMVVPAVETVPQRQWSASPVAPIALPTYEVPPKNGVRIMVPIKQIGKLGDDFAFTSDGRSIPSEYFEYLLNEWDDTALEQALQIIEQHNGGEVVAVTIGPAQADDSLRKVLAKGAHRGVRVWDESLADADPITLARLLAGVALQEQPDLILTGAQSGDQANGATGIALAKLLQLPSAALVVKAEWDGGSSIQVTRELEGGLGHAVRLPIPALVTMQTGANMPRYATMRMIKLAKDKPVVNIEAGDQADTARAAIVHRMSVPAATRAEMLQGEPDDMAAMVVKIIRDKTGAKA